MKPRLVLRRVQWVLLLGCVPLVGLVGCKRNREKEPGFVRPVLTQPSAPDKQGKLNGYVAAYNTLAGTFGLADEYRDYAEERIAKKTSKDLIKVDRGSLNSALQQSKSARDLPDRGASDLDRSGDVLIAALGKVVTRLQGLKVYYDSKAYQADDLARGKREDPAMLAEFAAAMKAKEQFDDALDAAIRRRDAQRLDALKSGGETLAYQSKLAMLQANGVLGAFRKAASLKDASLFSKCDPQIETLEETLKEQKAVLAKAKTDAKEAVPVEYELVGTYLGSFVQRYREVKQSRSESDYEKMVEEYNSAVEQANDLHD